MAAEHVATLQRIARVTPDQITPEVIADAKAASEAARECEHNYGHPMPHKSGDETWVDEDVDTTGGSTMPGDLCECCDLPPESCGKALEAAQRAEAKALRERLLQTPGSTAANWPLTCCYCGTRSGKGDPIRGSADGWYGLLCCPDGGVS